MTGESFLVSCNNNGYIKPKNIVVTDVDVEIMNRLHEAVCDTNINNLFITDYDSFPFSWIGIGETIMCLVRSGKRVMICR